LEPAVMFTLTHTRSAGLHDRCRNGYTAHRSLPYRDCKGDDKI
jgi:hypothetical protein